MPEGLMGSGAAAISIAVGMVTAILSMLVVGLLRSHAQVLRALHDAGIRLDEGGTHGFRVDPGPGGGSVLATDASDGAAGAPAADVSGLTPQGAATRVAVTAVSHHTLLVFLSTGCGACEVLWAELSSGSHAVHEAGGAARIVVVTQGPELESPAAVENLAPADRDVVMSSEAWLAYGVGGAPYFVLVDGAAGRVVGEGSAAAWSQVAELLGRAVKDRRVEGTTRRQMLTGGMPPRRSDRQPGGGGGP